MKKYVMAIDQGTTSTRCLLFDEQQNVVKKASKEIKNYFPHPGWVEIDGNEIFLSVLQTMAEVFVDGEIKPTQIACIGIANQRETTIIWDKFTGLPIYHGLVWQSRQTSDIVKYYKDQGYEPLIKEKTGLLLDPYFSATKIRWLLDNVKGAKDNPNLLAGTVDTFLLWKLTKGKVFQTDVSNASRTLLFNIHTLDWDQELLDIFGIKREMLAMIKDTSDIYGAIDPDHFFNTTCPITCLVGDQQASLFGQNGFNEGDLKNTYGTGGFLLMNTGNKEIISESGLLTTVAYKIKDDIKYALEGSIFVSGSLIQWLRDKLHLFNNAAETEAMAFKADKDNDLIIVPSFTGFGAPIWNDKCKGAIFGLTRATDDLALAKASLQAMALQVKDLINLMSKESGFNINCLKVDGGASSNNYLCQFQADILNMEVYKALNQEATALGAARLAGLAIGYYSKEDFKDNKFKIYKPNMNQDEVNYIYSRWQKGVELTTKY